MNNVEKVPNDLFAFGWNASQTTTWDDHMRELSEMAQEEKWGKEFKVLKNYLTYTYKYIAIEYNKGNTNYIQFSQNGKGEKVAVFNTGLFTSMNDPIYAFYKENKSTNPDSPKWFLIGFKIQSDYELLNFPELPNRMYYFQNADELVFNPRLQIRANVPHIIEDSRNVERLPESLRELPPSLLASHLQGAIDTAKRRAAACYSIAIPQYYSGRIQLLLPLFLTDSPAPDLVLAIYKENNIYSGRTCLTYDMAYSNARLLAKPMVNWLSDEYL